MLSEFFADMHIHIGKDIYGRAVKITASKQLTLTNILMEASRRKGIELIGVIDCQSPAVQKEISQLLENGNAKELAEGGIKFENVTLILGSEIEIYDEHCKGPIHVLCYFPHLSAIQSFSEWLATKMKNINLSSQRFYGSGKELQKKTKELSGLFIPAHIFTPFKSMYGKGVDRTLTEVFEPELIDGVELGLSSDTDMADQIEELHKYSFLTNSDSHSLQKIGREYQLICMEAPSFLEFKKALHQTEGRKITANYGMNPKLGKYHATVCQSCMELVAFGTLECPNCSSKKIVNGVPDRIAQLKTFGGVPPERPPYHYQVPLDYLPGLGPKTFAKLLDHFGTEMNVIHHVPFERLLEVVPEQIARLIVAMRNGEYDIEAGGGGKYGRIKQGKKD